MKITYDQIMALEPCYDPAKIGMPKDYEDTLEHFIKDYRDKIEDWGDIVWVAMRSEFFNEQDRRLFSVWCARQVQHLMQDERSIKALDVGERFAFGLATQQELDNARDAARDADAYSSAAAASAAYAAALTAASASASAAPRAARAVANAADAAAEAAAVYVADAEHAAVDAQIDTILRMINAPGGAWFERDIEKLGELK